MTAFDPKPHIARAKAHLSAQSDMAAAFSVAGDMVARAAEAIAREAAAGRPVIPELAFAEIAADRVSGATLSAIRRAGCVVVRGVFPAAEAEAWDAELDGYVAASPRAARTAPDGAPPQILALYWSRPQVMARQAESMAATKRFLNRLYGVAAPVGPEFDPDHDYTYADRLRRRSPGDATLGLAPHLDGGSFERWVDPVYQRIYAAIFAGAPADFDPWAAAFRTQTREFASPSVCSMYRSFQGWVALTPQGPGDGSLSLVPMASGIAYVLLRALQDDVAPDDLCGATPGRALMIEPGWHAPLLQAMVQIPMMAPGDTVWWHPDVVHAVAGRHQGRTPANVIYVAATPRCAKNAAYAVRQAPAFLSGRSPPDFAADDFETAAETRAGAQDLSARGRAQLCLP